MPTSEIPAPGIPGYGIPRYEPGRYDPPSWGTDLPAPPFSGPDGATGGIRRVSGLLDRQYEETGPVVEPDWWAYGSSDDPHYPLAARHGGQDRPDVSGWGSGGHADEGAAQQHPSAPLPPRPPGVWDRLRPRADHDDDAATVAQPTVGGTPLDRTPRRSQTSGPVGGHRSDDDTDAHLVEPGAGDPHAWDDQTGGLEVIGAHVE
ncbi:MAG TPA: hypothetical protein VNC79_04680 [Mycobacteriales bacterium]|nr:hypothetical protein [Mycobacteriales bacterium]